ncbi:MAG TPA: tetratricopeptide repeat protein [Bryobacteraceae bacterium]|nr:tetratricopeptide repeat protein [Bryobacteraceae bacterium]
MKGLLKIAGPLSVLLPLGLLLGGCASMFQSMYLAGYDRDISRSTQAIETARDDVRRAAAYTQRGSAYSEKARYSRAFKLISHDEYARLFGLAIKDHDQAIALDPASAEAYYGRGVAYYDRAVLEVIVNGTLVGNKATWNHWFDPAIADFRKATEKDPRHSPAWDRLGLSHETIGELDQAISDYTQEMGLDPKLGRIRLADAYCARGQSNQKEKKHDAAIEDYEKSIDTGATTDGCSCDPYNPLFGLYTADRRYDQGWLVVAKARSHGKWIMPELLDRLQKESGRKN